MVTKKAAAPKRKTAQERAPAKKNLTPQQEAKSESTPAKRLGELAEQSTTLARLVARNPAASATLLKKLGSDSNATVRKWVAQHPNTPPRVLVKLATQFPEQLLDNPVFEVLLLENPNLLNELPVGTRRSLAKREKCPVSLLEWLAQDYDEGVDLALAMNTNTPPHVLKRLGKSTSRRVSNAAQRHINFPVCGRAKRPVSEDDLGMALALERLPGAEEKTAARMLPWLACVGEPKDRPALEVLRNWAREQMEVLPLANSPYSDPATLTSLSDSNRTDVQLAVAKNPSAPARALKRLAVHPYTDVRQAVAENPSAPGKVLAGLAVDPDMDVRVSVAGRPDASSHVLRDLSMDKHHEVRAAVATNPAVSAEILANLSVDPDIDVRVAVAGRLDAPSRVLRDLSMDKHHEVRAAVAVNPSVSAEILAHLSVDKKSIVRLWVAGRLATPVAVLERLASDKKGEVRREVAAHPCTPQAVLDQLANRNDRDVRAIVARNPATGRDTLARLAKDGHKGNVNWRSKRLCLETSSHDLAIYGVRLQVASNPSTPADVLSGLIGEAEEIRWKAATHKNARMRDTVRAARIARKKSSWLFAPYEQALARHSTAFVEERKYCSCDDPDILRVMAKSIFPEHRILVAQNVSAPPDALKLLGQDKDYRVALCVKDKSAAEKTTSRPQTHAFRDRDAVLAGLPGVAHLVVEEYVNDGRVRVRRRLASNPLLPEKYAVLLAKDAVDSVRKALAENPGVSDTLLGLLADDAEKPVAKAAKAHIRKRDRSKRSGPRSAARSRRQSAPKVPIRHSLPPPKKADFSRLGDWQHLADLPSIEIARVIRLDDTPERERVAKRKELAEAFIEKYSRSNKASFKRLLCLLLPDCPAPVLARALRSTDWKERLATASHPKTPPAIRKQLADDGNEFVRAAARATLHMLADSAKVTTRI